MTRRGLLAAATGNAVAAGATGLSAAACGPPAPGERAQPAVAPATLRWAVWNGPTLLEAQAEGAQAFRARYPAVTLITEGFAAQPDNFTKWLGGSGPDVAEGWQTPMVDTGRQGMYLALDPLAKRDARAVPLQDYLEWHLKALQWPGVGLFALPKYMNVFALYYNKALFQRKGLAPPDATWDWQRYQDALARITERDQGIWGGVYPASRQGLTKVFQNGGEVVDPKDDRKAAFAGPEGLEALAWVHDRLWKDRTWAQTSDLRDAGHKDAPAALAAGKLATYEWNSWAPGDFARDYPDALNDWDIAPLPKRKLGITRQGIDACVIWRGTPAPDAAWELLKFLQGTEWLDIQARHTGYPHPRVSMQDHWIDLMKQTRPALAGKNLQAFAYLVKNRLTRPDAIFRRDADAWKIIDDTWAATMARNELPVADAFREAARQIDAAMAGS